jgi:asparagine synthase (glutamine-hydrolysing)
LVRETYFDKSTWEAQEPFAEEDAYVEALREAFGRIVPRYVRGGGGGAGGQAVAMSLTGGLDSRAVLAWNGARPGDAYPCYSFAGPYRDCADVTIARRLAAMTGHPHQTIRIENDFFEQFPQLAEQTVSLSDGTMDVSGAVELYVNRKARAIAPVRITGNYGSEILRENVAFRPRKLDRGLYTPGFNELLDQAEATYAMESKAVEPRLSFIAFKQVPWHHYGRLSVEQSQLTPRSPFLDNDLVALAYRAPKKNGIATSARPMLRLIAEGNPAFAGINTDRALRLRPVPVVLRALHAWKEFSAKAEYAYDYGMPDRFVPIDNALSRLQLERLFLGRHKFYHFRLWYKKQLREMLEKAVGGTREQLPWYAPGKVNGMIAANRNGVRNHTVDLHKLLTVALAQQLFAPTAATAAASGK